MNDLQILEDEISKLPTKTIRLFREYLSERYQLAQKERNAMHQLEQSTKSLTAFIINDEVNNTNITNAVINCSKQLEECIL